MRTALSQLIKTFGIRPTGTVVAGLVALCGTFGLSDVTSAATIQQTTRFFFVRGTTLADLDRDLNRAGPFVSETGMHHPGATEVRFSGTVTYRKVRRGCVVDQPNIALKLDIILPKWQRPPRVTRQTVIIWSTLAADIERHELQHAAIATNYLKRLEMALRNLQFEKSCRAMKDLVNRVINRYLSEHQTAQTEFDRVEGREVNIRLQRALSRTLAGYPAN